MRDVRVVASLALISALAVSHGAHAAVIYSNDFESVPGAEWSHTNTATTLSGRDFLGIFVNENVTLTLPGIIGGTPLTVDFDLFVINTWDGRQDTDPLSDPAHQVGPDVWQATADSGPTLVNSTFSVFDGTKAMHSFRNYPQAYPGTYPADSNPARSGAAENDTLGYFEGDSVYHIHAEFAAPGGPLTLRFHGDFPAVDPEEWGLDNVVVTMVPEPSGLSVMIALGLGALCARPGASAGTNSDDLRNDFKQGGAALSRLMSALDWIVNRLAIIFLRVVRYLVGFAMFVLHYCMRRPLTLASFLLLAVATRYLIHEVEVRTVDHSDTVSFAFQQIEGQFDITKVRMLFWYHHDANDECFMKVHIKRDANTKDPGVLQIWADKGTALTGWSHKLKSEKQVHDTGEVIRRFTLRGGEDETVEVKFQRNYFHASPSNVRLHVWTEVHDSSGDRIPMEIATQGLSGVEIDTVYPKPTKEPMPHYIEFSADDVAKAEYFGGVLIRGRDIDTASDTEQYVFAAAILLGIVTSLMTSVVFEIVSEFEKKSGDWPRRSSPWWRLPDDEPDNEL